jgi:phosphocarrier protein
MMLAAGKGATIIIEAQGDDARCGARALLKLIADKFDEGE